MYSLKFLFFSAGHAQKRNLFESNNGDIFSNISNNGRKTNQIPGMFADENFYFYSYIVEVAWGFSESWEYSKFSRLVPINRCQEMTTAILVCIFHYCRHFNNFGKCDKYNLVILPEDCNSIVDLTLKTLFGVELQIKKIKPVFKEVFEVQWLASLLSFLNLQGNIQSWYSDI